MAKSREELMTALESVAANLHAMEKEIMRRAKAQGIPIWKMQNRDGALAMEKICCGQASVYLAMTMLLGELEEEPKELLFDEMMHIYWSGTGVPFCLSPPGVSGFLSTRGFEAGRPDCPDCHDKLEQFRSM